MDRRDFLIQTAQIGMALTAGDRAAHALSPEPHRKTDNSPPADWPVYRHDAALTGVSPGKGRIRQPEVLWEYYLGAPFVPLATDRTPQPANVADLDDDGFVEVAAVGWDGVLRIVGQKA